MISIMTGGLLIGIHLGLVPLATVDVGGEDIRVTDCEGTERGTLDVGVATSTREQYVGLSRTESLGQDEGVLFVFDEETEHQVGMRGMDFGIDVLFVADNGTVSSLASLQAPASRLEAYVFYERTIGEGRYVIETNHGWSEAHGVREGDCVTDLPTEL